MMLTADERLVLRRARQDPVYWIENVLGANLWHKQRQIVRALWSHKRVAVASCHGTGKSFGAARAALAFLFNHSPSVVITTAPTQRQVEKILWKELRVAHKNSRSPLGGAPLTRELKLDDDWYAFGFSAGEHDPDRWQGWHEVNLLVIVDEAAGVGRPVFDGVEGALASDNAHLLMIGNPTNPAGAFADAFKNPSCAKFHISAFDTPNFTAFGITLDDIVTDRWLEKITGPLPAPWLVTPEWAADRARAWGVTNPLFVAKVLGQFPDEDESSLIPMAWVQAAQLRELEPDTPHALGLDVARQGNDSTVCFERRGDRSRRYFTSTKEKTTQTTGRAVRALKDTGARRIHVDGIGIGAGVCDNLEEQELPVTEINFGASPRRVKGESEEFVNLKAQLYWNMRKRYEEGRIDIDPDDEELAAQAVSIRWFVDSKGRIAVEKKEDMKKRGEPSPDAFEAQAYSFADDVLGGRADFDIDLSNRELVRPNEWRGF